MKKTTLVLSLVLFLASVLTSATRAETIVIDADNSNDYKLDTEKTFEVKTEKESWTLSGAVSGESALTKAGRGTLTLSNPGNQLAGGIKIEGPDSSSPFDTPGWSASGKLILQRWSSVDTKSSVKGNTSALEILDGDLIIGEAATGTLTIGHFAKVTASQGLILGNQKNGSGTIELSGNDASLIIGEALNPHNEWIIGNFGTGELKIGTGGATKKGAVAAVHGFMTIGKELSGKGTVTVDGVGTDGDPSILNILGYDIANPDYGLVIGNEGEGTLNITKGGSVTSEYGILIGNSANTKSGAVSIDAESALLSKTLVEIGASGIVSGTGTITAQTIRILNGGTISSGDLTGKVGTLNFTADNFEFIGGILKVDIGLENTSDTLAVDGNIQFGPGDKIVDFSGLQSDGTYKLITATGTFAGADDFQFLLNGESLVGTRADAAVITGSIVGNAYQVEITGTPDNMVLTWDNRAASTEWNLTDKNWLDSAGQSQQFFDGDSVTFRDTNQEIKLTGTSKTVAMMTVAGDAANTAFDGDLTISSTLTNLTDDALKTGKLHKSGNGTLTLYGKNEITRGTELSGGTIVVANDEALGKFMLTLDDQANSAGTVNVIGNATVKSRISKKDEEAKTPPEELMPRKIQNRFAVANDTKLIFDITDYSLTIDGVLNTDKTLTEFSKGGAIHLAETGTFEVVGWNPGTDDPAAKREFVISGNTADLGGGVYAEHAVVDAPITFKTNNGFRGGGVYATSAAFKDNVTFDSNTALEGAGVYAETILFGDNTVFKMNSGQMGGGIWAHAAAFGDHTTFTSNSGQQGGAAYADELTFGNYTTFSSNTAQWGSIAFAQTVKFGNHTTLSGNNAQFGGGIYGKAPGSSASFMDHGSFTGGSAQTGSVVFADSAAFGAHMTFSGNMSNGEGGVLKVIDASLRGNTAFSGNSAEWAGGAIHGQNIILNADIAGDIVFSGNEMGKDVKVPNSIFLTEDGKIELLGGGHFYFDDAITIDTTYGGRSLSKDGTGFVQFAGTNLLNPDNKTGGGVSINEGIFRLVKTPGAAPTDPATEASFTTGGKDGELFNVGQFGTVAGSGKITSSNGFLIQGTLSPDDDRFAAPTDVGKLTALRSRTVVAEDKLAGTLSLTGDVTLQVATLHIDADSGNKSDKIIVAGNVTHLGKSMVDIGNWENGTFQIMTADAGLDAAQFNLLENGEDLYYRHHAALNGDGTTLELVLTSDNLTLNWAGTESNVWDIKTGNWLANGQAERFIKDDNVVFGEGLSGILVAENVRVDTMSVTGGVYRFSGERIRGNTLVLTENAEAGFANTLDLAAIQITDNAAMRLLDGFAFTEKGHKTIDIAGSGTLLFGNEQTMLFGGTVTGSGGSVKKVSPGKLTLTGDSSYTGTFFHDSGNVILSGIWGGDFAAGTQAESLIVKKAKAEPAPAPAPLEPEIKGTLSVQGNVQLIDTLKLNNLRLDDGTVTFDVRAVGDNGKITLSGTVTETTASQLNIGAWTNKAGTFDLIIGTTIDASAFNAPTVGGMLLDNGRQTLTLQNSGNTLQAVLTDADSIELIWSGAVNVWNTTASAWGAEKFAHGDSVIFDAVGSANNNITVGGDVMVAGMIVNGDYSFTGSSITGAAASGKNLAAPGTGKLDIQSGTTTLNTLLTFESGIEIQVGAKAILGDEGVFDSALKVDVKRDKDTGQTGLLVIDRSKDYTLDNVFSGDGNVEKTGVGNLTIAALNTGKGLFTQSQGEVRILGDATWGGDYVQKSGATLVGEDGAKIQGNMTISGIVEANGSIFFGKEATDTAPPKIVVFDGATLKFGLDSSGVQSDRIVVLGDAKFGNEKNTVVLDAWVDGTFALMWTGMLDDITGKFNDIIFTDGALSPRQQAYLEKFDTTLLLHTTAKNMYLTWNVDDGVWDYEAANWQGSEDGRVIANDHAIFTGGHSGTVDVQDSGVQTSGMSVQGGHYVFTGGGISGTQKVSPDFQADGILRISGSGTVAEFFNALNFSEGIIFGKGSETTLGNGSSAVTKKEFLLEHDTNLNLDVAAGLIQGAEVHLNGNIAIVGMPLATPFDGQVIVDDVIVSTDSRLNVNRFESLFNITQALKTQTALFDDTRHRMGLQYEAITVRKFADEHDLSRNNKMIADLYDAAFMGRKADDVMNEFYDYNFDAEVIAALEASLGAELMANAQSMALWNPWRIANDRLYDLSAGACSTGRFSTRNTWFEGYYRSGNVSGDGNASGYYLRRGGMMLGIDTNLNARWVAGAAFGYGAPQVSNTRGKVEADDYTFAVYSKAQFGSGVLANMFLGYGYQNYQYRTYRHEKTTFSGDSAYASIEFVKPFKMNRFSLLPLFAVDFQKARTGAVSQAGGGPLTFNTAKSDYEQTVLRFGLNARWHQNNGMNLRTRLQYGIQVAGDQWGTARTAFSVNPGESRMLSGVNLGRSTLNVGFGGDRSVSTKNRTRLFADYDFDLGERATAHTGQVGFVANW